MALAAALLLMVTTPHLWAALQASRGLVWPPDVDFNRSIALAQVMADGDLRGDPFYRGERNWYPPLVPALVALASVSTGTPIPRALIALGPWLNLLTPLLLFVVARRFFGLFGSTAALLEYFHGPPDWVPSWATGSYSPWPFNAQLGLFLFLGGLLAADHAVASRRRRWIAVTGVLFGAAFLGQPASAVLLAPAVSLLLWLRARESSIAFPLRSALAIGAVAALTASPLLLNLASYGTYVNQDPAQWTWSGLDTPSLPLLFRPHHAIAFVGVVMLLRSQAFERCIALTALAAAAVVFGLGGGGVLPQHHALPFFYLGLSLGLGAVMDRFVKATRLPMRAEAGASVLIAVLVTLFATPYSARRDFDRARVAGEDEGDRKNPAAVYEWLRRATVPSDVVLAHEDDALRIVAPAGRGTIVVPSLWANPFVDNESRFDLKHSLLRALDSGDDKSFCAQAEPFHVTHLLSAAAEFAPAAERPFERAFSRGRLVVWSVNCSAQD
jgi:hypothetical protein